MSKQHCLLYSIFNSLSNSIRNVYRPTPHPSLLTPHSSPKIYISAGESSGDLLGADLALALLRQNPNYELMGMGGKKMADAGVTIQFSSEKLSVVGLFEIVKHLPSILSTISDIKKFLKNSKPDAIVLIDFPDTHFRLLKTAKKLKIPVIYYVSPQIWAWRYNRINILKKYVDHMCVLFSFEKKIYEKENIPVTFVGHPLSQIVKPSLSKEEAYAFFELDPTKPIIALFPGSRSGELARHLPLMIEPTDKIRQQIPNVQFVLVLAPHFDKKTYQQFIPSHIKIIQQNHYDLLNITHSAIAVSGTVTLEIALMKVPLCIIYKLNPFSHWIMSHLIRIKYIGLCNIVLEKKVAQEFVQNDATAENIEAEMIKLLSNYAYYQTTRDSLSPIKNHLISVEDASQTIAKILFDKNGV